MQEIRQVSMAVLGWGFLMHWHCRGQLLISDQLRRFALLLVWRLLLGTRQVSRA